MSVESFNFVLFNNPHKKGLSMFPRPTFPIPVYSGSAVANIVLTWIPAAMALGANCWNRYFCVVCEEESPISALPS